ncbi:hypothetical protein DFS34DRAFT_143473 [Phlyctochytrium arcticum]|nr:hypothetical protein DFS34DRAFT_672613 [Phlyctochytrium arcticum]KAI9095493.1 hypothetical protein DFS34DRAFT_176289 [Phlyctochytrium arcticum]KAI9096488.1 hypothetical protein DFS34DRAFT_143473 [Phlyctochytrium arcticum]
MAQTQLFKYAKKMHAHNRAFIPIPASIQNKCPIGKWSNGSYIFEKDFKKREQADCNLSLIINDQYMVIDVDNRAPSIKNKSDKYSERTGIEDFQELVEQNEHLPSTLSVTTPSGGKHYYFSLSGSDEEAQLKNWAVCMTLNDKLIAVDVRKQGGCIMCPPSKKKAKLYTWDDTNLEYKKEMAPLPKWILDNILTTMKKTKKHFELQQFTANPVDNTILNDEDVILFKESEYYQDHFQIDKSANRNNIFLITATKPYECKVCKRKHVKNSNHPFLVRHNGVLRFVCRSGKGNNVVVDKDYLAMWNAFDDKVAKKIVEDCDCSNKAISEALFALCQDTVYPCTVRGKWQHFNPKIGIWQEQYHTYILRPYFDKLAQSLNKLSFICHKIHEECVDDTNKAIWSARGRCAKVSESDVKTTREKGNIIQALYELIGDMNVANKFNSFPQNLHFTNCVFDLKEGVFRDSVPSDYSTMSTNLEYIPYKDHPQEKKDIIHKFLNDFTCHRSELKHFLLKALASGLDRLSVDQLLFLFHGYGSNAKSLLAKLIRKACGDYSAPISSALVARPTVNAQAATPALLAMKHIRSGILTELEQKSLYTEFLKLICSGDETSARGLYEGRMEAIKLAVVPFIMLNSLPVIHDNTKGFWRRVVVIPCEAQFEMEPDPKNAKQMKIVNGFEEKVLECADTFVALLVDVYLNDYQKEGIKVNVQPQIVRDAHDKYQMSQNISLAFEQNALIKVDGHHILVSHVNTLFRSYCKNIGADCNRTTLGMLHDHLDRISPPNNQTRQIWVAADSDNEDDDDGKNVKGWKGFKFNPDFVTE